MKKRTRIKAISVLMAASLLQVQLMPAAVMAADQPENGSEQAVQEVIETSENDAHSTAPETTVAAEEEQITEEVATDSSAPAVEEEADEEVAAAAIPVIENQPGDSTVFAGEQAGFHVQASGDNLTYQWQWSTTPNDEASWKNNSSTGFNQPDFYFTTKAAFNGRYYRCQVSSGNESDKKATVTTRAAALKVKTFDILAQTLQVDIADGSKAVFEVETVGTNLTYQWQWSTTPEDEDSWKNNTSTGFNAKTFSFTAKTAFNGRYYRCKVTKGTETVTSKAILLNVSAFAIIENPQNIALDDGDKVSFHVAANGSGMTYQWQWSTSDDPNGKWTNNTSSGYNKDTFSFTTKTALSGRYYRCVVKNGNGKTVTSDAASLTVTRPDAPSINAEPEDATVDEGSKVSYHVGAEGKDLTYQWQWSTSANGKYTNNTSGGYNTNTLSFTGKGAFNGRYYRCVITDKYGRKVTTRAALTTILSDDAPVIIEQPMPNQVFETQDAYYHVSAGGTGLTYQWQWANSEDGVYTNNTGKGYNTDTFQFTTKSALNGRYYRCMIKDTKGHVVYTESAYLLVDPLDSIILFYEPQDVFTDTGKTVRFHVEALAKGLTYQWQWSTNSDPDGTWRNNTSGGYNTNTLTFTAKDAFNGRFYRCKLTDSLGNVLYTNPAAISVGQDMPMTVISMPSIGYVDWTYGFAVQNAGSNLKVTSSDPGKATVTDENGNYYLNCHGSGVVTLTITSDGKPDLTYTLAIYDYLNIVPKFEGEYRYFAPNQKASLEVRGLTDKTRIPQLTILSPRNSEITPTYNSETSCFEFTPTEIGIYNLSATLDDMTIYTTVGVAEAGSFTILQQPYDMVQKDGDYTDFHVDAVGTDLTYQWQWSLTNDPNGTWNNATSQGSNTDTFGFYAKKAFDGRFYRCVVKDGKGNTRISEPGYLSISNASGLAWTSTFSGKPVYYSDEYYDLSVTNDSGSWLNFTIQKEDGTKVIFDQYDISYIHFCFPSAGTYTITVELPEAGTEKLTKVIKVEDGALAPMSLSYPDKVMNINQNIQISVNHVTDPANSTVTLSPSDLATAEMTSDGAINIHSTDKEGTLTYTISCPGKEDLIGTIEIKEMPTISCWWQTYLIGDPIQVELAQFKSTTGKPELHLPDGFDASYTYHEDEATGRKYFEVIPNQSGDLYFEVTWNDETASDAAAYVYEDEPDAGIYAVWVGAYFSTFHIGEEKEFILHNVPEGKTVSFEADPCYEITLVDASTNRYKIKVTKAPTENGNLLATINKTNFFYLNNFYTIK